MPQDNSPFALRTSDKLDSGLYVVATPIGNMRDITLRGLDVLACADTIYCEDTRITAKLMRHYQFTTPLAALHAHSEARVTSDIITRLQKGAALALVSDAGTPLISDPGARLVAAVRTRALPIFTIPGASAPIAAMSIAGLGDGRFCFVGFLPPRAAAREKMIATLPHKAGVLILFESSRRIVALLTSMTKIWGNITIMLMREMTKYYEEVLHAPASELIAQLREHPRKGEFVVLVMPPDAPLPSQDAIDTALRIALVSMSHRDAAAHIAQIFRLKRRDIYRRILALQK